MNAWKKVACVFCSEWPQKESITNWVDDDENEDKKSDEQICTSLKKWSWRGN